MDGRTDKAGCRVVCTRLINTFKGCLTRAPQIRDQWTDGWMTHSNFYMKKSWNEVSQARNWSMFFIPRQISFAFIKWVIFIWGQSEVAMMRGNEYMWKCTFKLDTNRLQSVHEEHVSYIRVSFDEFHETVTSVQHPRIITLRWKTVKKLEGGFFLAVCSQLFNPLCCFVGQ